MRVYDISCPRCLWRSPLAVDESVAAKFRQLCCQECAKLGVGDIRFQVKERIVVGPVTFFPHKGKGVIS